MIVRRIEGRWILGLAESFTIGIGKRAKVVIESVVFFDDNHDMFYGHVDFLSDSKLRRPEKRYPNPVALGLWIGELRLI